MQTDNKPKDSTDPKNPEQAPQKQKYFKGTFYVKPKQIMDKCGIRYAQQFKRARERFGLYPNITMMAVTSRKTAIYAPAAASRFVERYLEWIADKNLSAITAIELGENINTLSRQISLRFKMLDEQLAISSQASINSHKLASRVDNLKDRIDSQAMTIDSLLSLTALLESIVIHGRAVDGPSTLPTAETMDEGPDGF